MYALQTAAWLLLSFPFALSHGGGMVYTIDDVQHFGSVLLSLSRLTSSLPSTNPCTRAWASVYNTTTGSIQRDWTWDAVLNVSSPDLACRTSGKPKSKSYHAPMTAGSTVYINYTDPTRFDPPWVFGHGYGPMIAYMAPCPDTGCENLDLTAPVWFKIWQVGLVSGNWANGYWPMADIMNFKSTLNIPTPKNLKKGKYLLKHDMISIETGAMQIFPNCVQLEVSGEGTSAPTEKELVAFPGAYDGYDGMLYV
jgi:lytic cellulose monooxygenase (C1-hydroxylating)